MPISWTFSVWLYKWLDVPPSLSLNNPWISQPSNVRARWICPSSTESGTFFYFYPYDVWLCSSRIIWILWMKGEKVKPVFLKDEDVFGSSMKPARSLWLTNVEIYKAIGVRVPSQCIKGIQRSLRLKCHFLLVLYHVNSGSIAQFEHHWIVHSSIDYL
jgi:hypothetical protein